jgi:hypothetical protein
MINMVLIVFGLVLGLALIAVAYHMGYFIRDLKEHMQALTTRLDAVEKEQVDDTPAVVTPKTPKEAKLHKFDPEDDESAIIDPLTPKEVAEQKHKRTLKEIEEADV